MRRIGTILHFSPHGNIIAQADPNFLPRLRSKVYIKDNHIGFVIDIFGPVKQPYLSISFSNRFMEKEKEILYPGALLYSKGKHSRKKHSKGKRKRNK